MRTKILELLKSQEQISGAEISKALGISRTAVWKHIQKLQEEGYVIEAATKSGYRLKSVPDTLLAQELEPLLTTRELGRNFIFRREVTSTNDELRQLADAGAPAGTVLLAEVQTKGKGRLGRHWISPSGVGIWFSMLFRPDLPVARAPEYTLVTAVAVAEALQSFGLDAKIKWPNDVLIDGAKVCGILSEMRGDMDGLHWLIVGAGINVGQQALPEEIAATATSLALASGKSLRRSQVAAAVLNKMEYYSDLLQQQGFEPIRQRWLANAMVIGKEVKARTPSGVFEGIAMDLDANGCLLLRNADGKSTTVITGDIVVCE